MPNYNDIASKGRYGDTTLMHVSPLEVEGLGELLGRPLPSNPDTGYPEAFVFTLPIALGLMAAGGVAGAIAGKGKLKNILLGMGLGFTAGAGGAALTGGAAAPTMASVPTIAPTIAPGLTAATTAAGSAVIPASATSLAATPGLAGLGGPGAAGIVSAAPITGPTMASVAPTTTVAQNVASMPLTSTGAMNPSFQTVGGGGGGPIQFMGQAPPGGGFDIAGANQAVSMNPATADPAGYMDVLGMPDRGAQFQQALSEPSRSFVGGDVRPVDMGIAGTNAPVNPAAVDPSTYLDTLGMSERGTQMEQAIAQGPLGEIPTPVAEVTPQPPADVPPADPSLFSSMGSWMKNNPGLTLMGMYGLGSVLPQGGDPDWDDDYGDYSYEGDSSWSDRGDPVFMDDDEEFTSRERDYYPRYI